MQVELRIVRNSLESIQTSTELDNPSARKIAICISGLRVFLEESNLEKYSYQSCLDNAIISYNIARTRIDDSQPFEPVKIIDQNLSLLSLRSLTNALSNLKSLELNARSITREAVSEKFSQSVTN